MENLYEFEIPIELSPAKRKYSIGEEIIINISFPDELKDQLTNNIYHLKHFPFNTEIGFARIDTVPAQGGNTDFQTMINKGELNKVELTRGEQAWLVDYAYDDNRYNFEIIITPKKIGLYEFGAYSLLIDEINYKIDPDCSKEDFKIWYNTNNRINNNYDLLEKSPDPEKKANTHNNLDLAGAFYFEVIN